MSVKKIYALSVGICEYKDLPKLSCATSDADDFAAVVRAGVIPSEVKVLRNTDATKESIVKDLAWLAHRAGPGDTAIVFFSGHGGRRSSEADDQAFLCPAGASLLDLEQTCITSDEFTDVLRTIRSERLVVFLDTCYAGGIGDLRHRGPGILVGLTSRDVDSFVEGSGRMVLGASRPDELAWELGEMRNGLFTGYVLRALRGEVARADGSIWATDVFSFVSRSLRPHRSQRPYQKAVGEDFVIMVQNNEASLPTHASAVMASSIDQRPLRIAMRRAYNRDEISVLCRDLGLSLEDLPGKTLETQLMDLIEYCHRHGLYSRLIERMRIDRPQLTFPELPYQT